MRLEKRPETAVVGAGIAGSWLAFRLASQGIPVRLFDPLAPWEKPCGGGLTAKVFWDFPELRRLELEGREHHRVEFIFPSGRRASLGLSAPLVTVSRKRLGELLLNQAIKAGAEFQREKVTGVFRKDNLWSLRAGGKEYEAQVVVAADGVNSLVRRTVAGRFEREDLCLAYSALIPETPRLPLTIKFWKGVAGYAWIFPRKEGTSVGLALAKSGARLPEVSVRLSEFVEAEFKARGLPPPSPFTPRPRLLPSLREKTFTESVVCGEDWALIGDASGAADPVTGEGIYYALATASLLAQSLLSGKLLDYQRAWQRMAQSSIGHVSKVAEKFYRPFVLRAIGFLLTYSPAVRSLTRELISGDQGYDTLKSRVKMETGLIARETLWNLLSFQKGERKHRKRRG